MLDPLTVFEGTLRQITTQCLTRQCELVLRACAPLFLPVSESERRRLFDQSKQSFDPRVKHIYVPSRRFRRFSGDLLPDIDTESLLPAGNYFSVCNDVHGTDYNTLANELNAYRSTEADFYCMFADCLDPKQAQAFGLLPSAHILAIVAHPKALRAALPGTAPPDLAARLQDAASSKKLFVIQLGCELVEAKIDGVLDLRREEAQDWFYRRYVPAGPIPTPATRFLDILPELMHPALGGTTDSNSRLQGIGADLRRLGINALIYPSARSNVAVKYQGGRVAKSKGWNMIIYGQAPHPQKGAVVDLGGWETEFAGGAKLIEFPSEHEDRGWQVVGIEELLHLRYRTAMEKRGLGPAPG